MEDDSNSYTMKFLKDSSQNLMLAKESKIHKERKDTCYKFPYV